VIILVLFALNLQVPSPSILETPLPDYTSWCTAIAADPSQFSPAEQAKLSSTATARIAKVAAEANLTRIGVPYVDGISATTDEQGKIAATVRYCAVVPNEAPVLSGDVVVAVKVTGAKATASICEAERVNDCQRNIAKHLNADSAKNEDEVISSTTWRVAGTTAMTIDERVVIESLTASSGFVLPPAKAPASTIALPPISTRVVVAAIAFSR
jgi:hypothetical protein